MNTKLVLLVFISLTGFVTTRGQHAQSDIDILHYDFNISLNDSTDIISGRTVITLTFIKNCNTFSLEFRNKDLKGRGMVTDSVSFDRPGVAYVHNADHLVISARDPFLAGTKLTMTVFYRGMPGDGLIISRNKFGNRTFFADHWPDRASNYLPVINEPSEKATVDFLITAPPKYKIVASGRLVEESELKNGYHLTHWKENVPLPVKVMAFGAASFSVSLAGVVHGTEVWTWVYPENRLEGFRDYSDALKPLEFYMNNIGPYPYEKLANVQSRTIFGGLENASCIFYSENSVTGQGKTESLLAHEIAHQWFGNSVTERDWHHIWLSEGFATYLTSLYLEHTYGDGKFRESMLSARERVIRSSARAATPVIDTTITDLMKLLSANSYQKGAWVLHMLRQEIGFDMFMKGLREYYRIYRDSSALTNDFMGVMESVSGKDLDWFFEQWLTKPGEPALKISLSDAPGGKDRSIVIEQTQPVIFRFNIEVRITSQAGSRVISIPVKDKITRFPVKDKGDIKLEADPDVKLLFREIK
ncbi:MAG: M1 family metallopeptidase [Bacteroidales bacterium]